MNKDLDHLFEQARKSMQSEMPLEEVQGLIHGQASPSLWTKKTTWIMSTSIIGILTIGIACWFNGYNQPTSIAATETSKESSFILQQNSSPKQPLLNVQEAIPDNIPLPLLNQEDKIIAPSIPSPKEPSKTDLETKTRTKLDSLGPKKTFTEYTLEIKKENSEQEIKKLKTELSNYGIHMDVKILDYDNANKIKRFKGKFKTDSLFCGSTMNDYEFDISGAFTSMQFIFRVADDKNLKYLKIQSENFEETIECYDDEVISSTQEARKLNRQIQEEMAKAQEEMANAQEEMANAQQEMARAQEKISQMEKETSSERNIIYLDDQQILNWDKIENDIEMVIENVEFRLEDVNEEVRSALEDVNVSLWDKNLKKDMKILQKDLAKMRIDIELQVKERFKKHKTRRNKNKDLFRLEETNRSSNLKDKTAKELSEEADAMEKAAKELAKEAKKRRDLAKKKAKNK